MATARVSRYVRADALVTYTRARSDLLQERQVTEGRFRQSHGPFRTYERIVDIRPSEAGTFRVDETTVFRLDIPLWGPLVDQLMRRALAEEDRRPRERWWWPAELVGTQTTRLIALLSVIGMIGAFIGVTLGQTITFAAAEFGSSDSAQANALAATRIGVIATTLIVWRADRLGRKPLLVSFTALSCAFTVAGAFSTSLTMLAVTQAIARGFATGLLTLVTLAATEEIPKTMRAFILSILTLCGALGAGAVVWVLPLAGLDVRGWRLVYLVPVLFLPASWWLWRHLPETRRFLAAERVVSPGLSKVNLRHFAVLVFIYTSTSVFLAPAGQLQNEYLRGDLGFSAADISLFRLVISTPAGLVVLLAGWVADRRGRRTIGAVSMVIGLVTSWLFFANRGATLWLVGAVSVWLGGAAFPVIRAYQTELFPTRSRAFVGGWIDLLAVGGSAVGLLITARLIDAGNDIGAALAYLLPAALLAAAAIALLPDTARKELEVLNPSDPAPLPAVTPPPAGTA